jgi:tetratricopeptide (TPR) repeat protein
MITLRCICTCLLRSLMALWYKFGTLIFCRAPIIIIYLIWIFIFRALVTLESKLRPDWLRSIPRVEQLVDIDSLANEVRRQAWDLVPTTAGAHLLTMVANALRRRFEQLGNLDLLAEIIKLQRQALDLRPPGHPDHSMSVHNLATALQTRYEELGDLHSLSEAIELHRQALNLRPPGHSDRPTSQNKLALALLARYQRSGYIDSLAEAVELNRQALALRPPEHPDRSSSLASLAYTLQAQFEQLSDLDSLAEAVELYRQALALRPPGHRHRTWDLTNLANALGTRYQQLGDLDSLAEAVKLHRQVLDSCLSGNSPRAKFVNNLAVTLIIQFQHLGELDSLSEAVELHRQTLTLLPPGNPFRSMALNNLALTLHVRFEQLGDVDSLAEAIELHRQALSLRPLEHPDHSMSLNNLAHALHARYELLGNHDVLAEAIELHRQALALRPLGNQHRSLSLNNLANTLCTHFKQLNDRESLAEAVKLHRQALALRSVGHPDRSSSLINLAAALGAQFQRPNDMVNGPGRSFPSQHHMHVCDLDEELGLYKEGLQSCVVGHPMRIRFLFDIGKCMLRPGTHVFDFAEGIRYILEALRDQGSPARQLLGLATGALRMVEDAYQFLADNPGDIELGQHRYDDLVRQVYVLVIRLLPRAASFGLYHAGRLREVSGADAISRDAATRAIAAGRGEEAVEMLEEGRGVFWSQALRLRTTDMNLLPEQDARELRRLFQVLEMGSIRKEFTSTTQRERNVEERRRLSNAAEALIADIRSRPGMSRFLQPPAFASLVQSLPESGFVVVLVASNLGHRALVLDRAGVQSTSLELFPPEGGFYSDTIRVSLPRDGDVKLYPTEDPDVSRQIGFSRKTERKRYTPLDQTLAQLWISIVKPVIDVLGIKVCSAGVSTSCILR